MTVMCQQLAQIKRENKSLIRTRNKKFSHWKRKTQQIAPR